jgi:hypothetical protein
MIGATYGAASHNVCTRCKLVLSLCMRSKGVSAGDDNTTGSGYSPITDQRKPIMMKKPVNMAISPMPP